MVRRFSPTRTFLKLTVVYAPEDRGDGHSFQSVTPRRGLGLRPAARNNVRGESLTTEFQYLFSQLINSFSKLSKSIPSRTSVMHELQQEICAGHHHRLRSLSLASKLVNKTECVSRPNRIGKCNSTNNFPARRLYQLFLRTCRRLFPHCCRQRRRTAYFLMSMSQRQYTRIESPPKWESWFGSTAADLYWEVRRPTEASRVWWRKV